MPRRLVLHAGMFKTGSSSIQSFLSRAKLENATYFNWDTPNHSALFVLLFTDTPQADWIFRQRGLSAEELSQSREDARRALTRQIETSPHDLHLFSAERLYRSSRTDLAACKAFFDSHFGTIDVYCYVRDPMSYAASMLQQSLKTGNLPKAQALLPKFRRSIGNLDHVFGRNNVHLRLFDDPRRATRNIVADFCEWTGIESASDTDITVNTSMSAEATALLYLFHKHSGFTMTSDRAVAANDRMVRALMTLPGRRMRLSPEFFGEDASKIADDRHWLETRLGESLHPAGPRGAETVTLSGFDDLEAFGREVFLQKSGRAFDTGEWQGRTASPRRFAAAVTGPLARRPGLGSLVSSLARRKSG